jgi:hypothetical protein
MSSFIQPDYRTPVTPGVSVQVENQGNPLAVAWPLQIFVEKLSNKDDPQHTTRSGKSGH